MDRVRVVAVVGVGSLLLGGLMLSILLHVWKNTRQKAADRERRNLSPSEMSAGAQEQEFYRQPRRGPRICRCRARDAGGEERKLPRQWPNWKRSGESQQLEIVAFGTISSGKSSLLNALAGRPVFRTNVVGGTTTREAKSPGPPATEWCSSIRRGWPRCAARRGRPKRQRPRRTPTSCCSSSMGRSRRMSRSCSKRSRRWRSGSSSASTKKIGTTRRSAMSCCGNSRAGDAGRERRPTWWRCAAGRRSGGACMCFRTAASRMKKLPVEPDIGPLARSG